MPRYFPLMNERLRAEAVAALTKVGPDGKYVVKPGSRVEIKGPRRNGSQNAALWCKLGDIADQVKWLRRDPVSNEMRPMLMSGDSWKLFFLDELRRTYKDDRQMLDLVPNSDGTGWVNVGGAHSSDLTVDEMSDLLSLVSAFGDNHSVEWSEPKAKGDMRPTPPVEAYEGIA